MASTGVIFFTERSIIQDALISGQDSLLSSDEIFTEADKSDVKACSTTPFKSLTHTKCAKSDLKSQLRYLKKQKKKVEKIIVGRESLEQAKIIQMQDELEKREEMLQALESSASTLELRADQEQLNGAAVFITNLSFTSNGKKNAEAAIDPPLSGQKETDEKPLKIKFTTNKRKQVDPIDNLAKRRKVEEDIGLFGSLLSDVEKLAEREFALQRSTLPNISISLPTKPRLFEPLVPDLENLPERVFTLPGIMLPNTSMSLLPDVTNKAELQLWAYFLALSNHSKRHGSSIYPGMKTIHLPSSQPKTATTKDSEIPWTELEMKVKMHNAARTNKRFCHFGPPEEIAVREAIRDRWRFEEEDGSMRFEAGRQIDGSKQASRYAASAVDLAREIIETKMNIVAYIKILEKPNEEGVSLVEPLAPIPHHMRRNMVNMEWQHERRKLREKFGPRDHNFVGKKCRKGDWAMGKHIDFLLEEEKKGSMVDGKWQRELKLKCSSPLKNECLNTREALEEELGVDVKMQEAKIEEICRKPD